MQQARYFIDFIKHRLRSNSRHGTHSPFVYRFIEQCAYAREPMVSRRILEYFETLKSSEKELEGVDYGKDQFTRRTIGDYARTSALQDFQAHFMHRLVHFTKPDRTLELGSNLGKSLAAMASAHPEGTFVGVEGNEALSISANEHLVELNLTNASVMNSTFQSYLDALDETFDVVFLDGDHHFEPTMHYFHQLKSIVASNGLIVLHDIYWSEGMKRAWAEIKKDRDVVVTLDLFFFGLAWMGKPQAKENFSIRFPRSLVRLIF